MMSDAATSEDGYKVLHPVACLLRDTLCNPRNIADLLLLELHVRIKDAVLKLLQERELVQMHFRDEESVFQSCSGVAISSRTSAATTPYRRSGSVKESTIFSYKVTRSANLVNVVRFLRAGCFLRGIIVLWLGTDARVVPLRAPYQESLLLY